MGEERKEEERMEAGKEVLRVTVGIAENRGTHQINAEHRRRKQATKEALKEEEKQEEERKEEVKAEDFRESVGIVAWLATVGTTAANHRRKSGK